MEGGCGYCVCVYVRACMRVCVCVCVSITHLSLPGSWLSSVEGASKKGVEALFNGQEDEPGNEGAQISDDVIDSLLSKGEHPKYRHDIALS